MSGFSRKLAHFAVLAVFLVTGFIFISPAATAKAAAETPAVALLSNAEAHSLGIADHVSARDLTKKSLTCNRSTQARPHIASLPDLQVTFTGDPATDVTVDSLPYVVNYTITVTNIGTADQTTPFKVQEDTVSDYNDVTHFDTINSLAAGASQVLPVLNASFTAASVYGSGLDVQVDPDCVVNDADTNNNFAGHLFKILTNATNLGTGNVNLAAPKRHAGEGDVTVGEKGTLFFFIRNYGVAAPVSDVQVTITGLGKTLVVTIPVALLPSSGKALGYSLKKPQFSFKKAGDVPIEESINAPHLGTNPDPAQNPDTSISDRVIYVAPKGIDLSVASSLEACPAFANTPIVLDVYAFNDGTKRVGKFTITVSIDGAVVNTIKVKGLKTSLDKKTLGFFATQVAVTFPSAGSHTLTVVVDSANKLKDYDRTNNTVSGTFTVL